MMKDTDSRKPKRLMYEERAEEIAAPVAEQFGTHIYDVEFVREGEDDCLNVYIDKEGGVTIGDCENVSRILSDELDKADFIREPYTLVVSSPGLGRALTKDRHLAQSIGQDVEIHLYSPHPEWGEKDLLGELISFDSEQVEIMAEPPAPKKGKRKGKKKAAADGAEEVQEMPKERQKLLVQRSRIASMRLAFDF